jgi:hypothetical protein
MALSTRVSMDLAATLTSALDLTSPSAPLTYKRDLIWGSGTGASQADKVWSDQRTLTASSTEDLDLAGGSLTDALGGSLTFARVRALLIYAASGNTNNVVVGGDSNALLFGGAAAHTVTVRPGGLFFLAAPDSTGYVVTASTGDILQVANSGAGTSVTYDIIVIGASA